MIMFKVKLKTRKHTQVLALACVTALGANLAHGVDWLKNGEKYIKEGNIPQAIEHFRQAGVEGSVKAFLELCKIYGAMEEIKIENVIKNKNILIENNSNNNILNNNQNILNNNNNLNFNNLNDKAPVSCKTPASYILNVLSAIVAAEKQWWKIHDELVNSGLKPENEEDQEGINVLVAKRQAALKEWEGIMHTEGYQAMKLLFKEKADIWYGVELYVKGSTGPIMAEDENKRKYLDHDDSTGVGIFQELVKGMMKNEVKKEKPNELMEFFNIICLKMADPKTFLEKKYDALAVKAEGLEEKWKNMRMFEKQKKNSEEQGKVFTNKFAALTELLNQVLDSQNTFSKEVKEKLNIFDKKFENFDKKIKTIEQKLVKQSLFGDEVEKKIEIFGNEFKDLDKKFEEREELEDKLENLKIIRSYKAPIDINDKKLMKYMESQQDLTKIDLSGCKELTDVSIVNLAEYCKGLTSVNLDSCSKLTDNSIKALAENCKGLIEVNLGACYPLTNSSIKALAENCKGLVSVNLSNCGQLTDNGIKVLAENCKGLVSVNLSSCSGLITDSSIKTLAENCKGLVSVNLSCCRQLTDDGVKALAKNCKGLTSVNLDNCSKLTDNSIKALAENCKGLKEIWVTNQYVYESGMNSQYCSFTIKKCIGLITEQAGNQLKEMIPEVEVFWRQYHS